METHQNDQPIFSNEILSLISFHSPDLQTFFKLLATHRAFELSKAQKEKFFQRFCRPYEETTCLKMAVGNYKKYKTRGYKLPNGARHGFYTKSFVKECPWWVSLRHDTREILVCTGQYMFGKEDGKWLEWWDCTQPKTKINYVDGKRHGKYKLWSCPPNDASRTFVILKGLYFEGKKNGVWRAYGSNGVVSKREHYIDGKREGSYTLWHEEGGIKTEGQYLNDKKCGFWRSWTKDGKLHKEGCYKEGKEIGKWKIWYHE
jgi:hypothetical protein